MSNWRVCVYAIVIATLWWVLLYSCSDSLAHDDENCSDDPRPDPCLVRHFDPGGEGDPCSNLGPAAQENCGPDYSGGHGHLYRNAVEQEYGAYWPWTTTDTSTTQSPDPDYGDDDSTDPVPEPVESLAQVLEDIMEDLDIDDTPEEQVAVVEPEVDEYPCLQDDVPREYHEIQMYKGLNLVSFPVSARGIQTIGDLWTYQLIRDASVLGLDDRWSFYDENNDNCLTQNKAFVIIKGYATNLGMNGIPFLRDEVVTLSPGLNFVGFPTAPVGVTYISDLLGLGVAVIVSADRGLARTIDRAGDLGDGPLMPNQALFLFVRDTVVLRFERAVPAAPGVKRTVTSSWGDIKKGMTR